MKWYLRAFHLYADFSGRAGKKEFWTFVLYNLIFTAVILLIENVLGLTNHSVPYDILSILYFFALLIPMLSITVRRLHDISKSGWMVLLIFLPVVGWIWLITILSRSGTLESNCYGEIPSNDPHVYETSVDMDIHNFTE
ncbi:MAG: DUF805 domain-containing protein [Dysgonamonadaceae bacterium]